MFCEKCGANIEEGAKFCERCGAPVEQRVPAEGKAHGSEQVAVSTNQDKAHGSGQVAGNIDQETAHDSSDTARGRTGRRKAGIAIAVIGVIAVGAACAFFWHSGGEKNSIEYENKWKGAYQATLVENESDILLYQNGANEYLKPVNETTALCDLNGDETPELLFFTWEGGGAALNIYTYEADQVKKLEYNCAHWWHPFSGTENGFHTYEAGTGYDYLIFTLEGNKGFVICNEVSDETMSISFNKYKWEKNGISEPKLLGYGQNLVYGVDSDYIIPEYQYEKDGQAIDRQKYEKNRNNLLKNIDGLIFIKESTLEQIAQNPEYNEIWAYGHEKEREEKLLGASYEDTMEALQLQEVPE